MNNFPESANHSYEVNSMRKLSFAVMSAGLVLAVAVSNICSFVHDGKNLDDLRDSVLRLHILADSDSREAQEVKLRVRDSLLERSDEIFGKASDMDEALENAEEKLELIEEIAGETLSENGYYYEASAELADMYFEERTYGDITMPAGKYRTLRIVLGSGCGKNWWCVMYPPLCLPAALSEDEEESIDDSGTEEKFFPEEQCDILCKPEKYRVRFAIWDKIRDILGL